MSSNWRQDPRLKNIDPKKLSLLNEFAKRVESTPKDQLLPTLLNINMEANQKGIHFSEQESDLLISIMSTNMNPTERQRLETLRFLSRNFSKHNKK